MGPPVLFGGESGDEPDSGAPAAESLSEQASGGVANAHLQWMTTGGGGGLNGCPMRRVGERATGAEVVRRGAADGPHPLRRGLPCAPQWGYRYLVSPSGYVSWRETRRSRHTTPPHQAGCFHEEKGSSHGGGLRRPPAATPPSTPVLIPQTPPARRPVAPPPLRPRAPRRCQRRRTGQTGRNTRPPIPTARPPAHPPRTTTTPEGPTGRPTGRGRQAGKSG